MPANGESRWSGWFDESATGRPTRARYQTGLFVGLTVSVLVHAVVVAWVSVRARARVSPIDIELVELKSRNVKDYPLGGPLSGDGVKLHARVRPRKALAAVSAAKGTVETSRSDETTKSGSAPTKDLEKPAPAAFDDLSAYGPQGSRLTVLVRLDRLRGTAYEAAIDQLLLHASDRREFLESTGLDLFADFDSLLVATPSPADPTVTFLAAKHHLGQAAMRAALTRGAETSGRTLFWREERERLVGERRAREDGGSGPGLASDDRIVVLFDPGLAVVTPSAYRGHLFGAAAATSVASPDGGLSGTDEDGGSAAKASDTGEWTTLPGRIDAEEATMPSDGVVMARAVDLFTLAHSSAGDSRTFVGMEVPSTVSGTIGIDAAPFLDVTAAFATDAPARQWETEWPALQRRLREHPYASQVGFAFLVNRTTLARDGKVVRLHLAFTRAETTWLLGLALQVLASHGV
jgi:hypothetical protein